ncbi:Sec-independent protein translocase protein TatB [Bordetella petrii]|uniref:Sec-independent protein translocase protein TatB n=1 Tax=Bordetella petrii TaxID=94624 RepID=UPI001E580363|nr:Sec-independent protein translocase protein TatB [Bordetella petrii]MCD0505037.1 Sec-independent protein translocase protein TatB [Bordetella petrii]
MFDVSFTELMIIGIVALVVIGPERLPKVARTVGHLLGRAQRYVSDVKSDIRREIELDELRKFKSEMDDAANSVQSSLRDTENSLRSGLNETAREATQAVSGKPDAEPATPAAPAIPDTPAAPSAPAPAQAAAAQPDAAPDAQPKTGTTP